MRRNLLYLGKSLALKAFQKNLFTKEIATAYAVENKDRSRVPADHMMAELRLSPCQNGAARACKSAMSVAGRSFA